jgi:heptosyltransferase I
LKRLKRIVREALWAVLDPFRLFLWGRKPASSPKRILLLNTTHLGDVLISTGILPVLHSAFPGVEIGYAAGIWAKPILRDHPLIAFTHWVDVPSRNRAAISSWGRWKAYLSQRTIALRQIRALRYDWAISLNSWRPDLLDLAWWAGIPVRAAYKRHLMALFATHLADSPEDKHLLPEGACQPTLLRVLGVQEAHIALRRMSVAPDSEESQEQIKSILPNTSIGLPNYFVIHMGAGVRAREMPPSFWREVAHSLVKSGIVIFTGRGKREHENVDRVIQGIPGCINAVDRLKWDGLVALVRNARAVFSVDTSVCHLAAATGTPLIAVYTGITGVARWRPEGEEITIWTNHVPCSPCSRQNGCPEMTCLKGIRPADLLDSLQQCCTSAKWSGQAPAELHSLIEVPKNPAGA